MNLTVTELANAVARDAHENNFGSRRGTFQLIDDGTVEGITGAVVCVYDNQPWAHAPELRDTILAELGARCVVKGMRVLAEGAYPDPNDEPPDPDDEEPGYTKALIIAGGSEDDVRAIWWEVIARREPLDRGDAKAPLGIHGRWTSAKSPPSPKRS